MSASQEYHLLAKFSESNEWLTRDVDVDISELIKQAELYRAAGYEVNVVPESLIPES